MTIEELYAVPPTDRISKQTGFADPEEHEQIMKMKKKYYEKYYAKEEKWCYYFFYLHFGLNKSNEIHCKNIYFTGNFCCDIGYLSTVTWRT